jgi:hypothetical protein
MTITPLRGALAVVISALVAGLVIVGSYALAKHTEDGTAPAAPTSTSLPTSTVAATATEVGDLDLCVTLEVASLRRLLAEVDTETAWTAGLDEATTAPVRTEWACNWLSPADRLTAVTQALTAVEPEHAAKQWARPSTGEVK